eukprot:TRINITY_DN7417_c0_g1_i1.p1 TRINITY_DN7417_c0_g1~~TRINITY_DN7417_c0_g1_i1.p1  ORF type:complete len:918 (+),score=137.07 TRINITY_DN7417_c0_g1_i1:84-2756(+)
MERFSEKYTKNIYRYKYVVLGLWMVAAGCFAVFATSFIEKCSQAFNPLPGTDSANAVDMMAKYFPTQSTATNILVYFESTDGVNITDKAYFHEFDNYLRADMEAKYPPEFLSQYVSYYQLVNATKNPVTAAESTISPDGLTTFIAITISVMSTEKAATDCADHVQDVVNLFRWNETRATCLGLPSFINTIVTSTEANLGTVDAISIPTAMLVLMWILQSPRLLVLPLLNMGLTAASAFGIMSIVAGWMSVNSVAPSLMMSILVAMSIDYNLFLLTRYREELLKVTQEDRDSTEETLPGLPSWRYKVISTMINTAGETITVSAGTLGICFCGLLIIPMNFIQSVGIANGITIFVTLFINITVTPSMLFVFPGFFEKCTAPFSLKCWGNNDDGYEKTLEDDEKDSETAPGDAKRNIWWRLATFSMSFPNNLVIIFAIVAATIPFDIFAFNNKHTDAMNLFLPRDADTTKAYEDMAGRFGLGTLYPTQALVALRDNAPYKTVNDVRFYNQVAKFALALTEDVPYVAKTDIQGPMFVAGHIIEYPEIEFCQEVVEITENCKNVSVIDPSILPPPYNKTNLTSLCIDCIGLVYTHTIFTAENKRAIYFEISGETDPLGPHGADMRNAMLDVAKRFADSMNADVYYCGYNPITWDTIWEVFKYFGTMIIVEGIVVFVILTYVFKSLLIPLRAVGTIFLTVAFTFGFCDLVYEHNILGWTGIDAFKGVDGVEWTNTLVLFSMIVGIGLDYDIFLLTRIKEYYDEAREEDEKHGFTDDEVEPKRTLVAIHKGLCDTGHIITAAGLIMAVAFSGLFFSTIEAINQMGFYLVFSVLFDTFVVRSVLVPALMSLIGKYNWWPGPLFKECRKSNGYESLSTFDGIATGVNGESNEINDGEAE